MSASAPLCSLLISAYLHTQAIALVLLLPEFATVAPFAPRAPLMNGVAPNICTGLRDRDPLAQTLQ